MDLIQRFDHLLGVTVVHRGMLGGGGSVHSKHDRPKMYVNQQLHLFAIGLHTALHVVDAATLLSTRQHGTQLLDRPARTRP